jgi:hypothetical protein
VRAGRSIGGLRGLSRRVAELARSAALEQARREGAALRALSLRIIHDPEALEAGLALFECVCQRAGVDGPVADPSAADASEAALADRCARALARLEQQP